MKKMKPSRLPLYRQLSPLLLSKKYLYALFVLKAGLLAVGTVTPAFYNLFVDRVLLENDFSLLLPVIAGYILIFGLETVFLYIQRMASNRCFIPFSAKLKTKMLKNMEAMPFTVYDGYDVGDLNTRMQVDTTACCDFFSKQTVELIYHWGVVAVFGAMLFFVCWPLALFGFAMIPLSFLLTKTLKKKGGMAADEYRAAYGEYEGFVHTSLQNWREIKALNLEQQQSNKFSVYWDKLSPLFVKQQVYWFLNRGVIAFKDLFITRMNLYFLGGLLIFSSNLSIGGLLVFMVYYEKLFDSVNAINDLDISLAEQIPAITRVLDIIHQGRAPERCVKTGGSFAGLTLRQISFGYREGQVVLDDINLHIEPGERIAIVGKSGSGKTTLVRLLVNLSEPVEGEVMLGSLPINTIQRDSLYSVLGYIAQEPYFLNLSIRENLLLANRKADENQLDIACQKAQIIDFINTLSNGYDTIIGEKGIKLSGGQRQRMAIARAFLCDAPFLIMDEATSALDYEAEERVQQAINDSASEMTVLRVAHRLSAIKGCSRIIVLDNGKIVGDGQHKDLLSKCSVYASLFGE